MKLTLTAFALMATLSVFAQTYLPFYYPVPVPYQDVTNGLTGWYKFDTGYGTNALDSSANGNNGYMNVTSNSLTSATYWGGGIIGYSCFDVTAQNSLNAVLLGNKSYYNFGSGSFTVSAWLNTTFIGTVTTVAVGKINASLSGGDYYLGLNTSGFPIWESGDSSGSPTIDITGTKYICDGAWHHLLVERTNGVTTMYLDGVSNASASDSTTLNPTGGLSIGQFGDYTSGGLGFNWVGMIDDVRIFNRAVTSTEISTIYNTPFRNFYQITGSNYCVYLPSVNTNTTKLCFYIGGYGNGSNAIISDPVYFTLANSIFTNGWAICYPNVGSASWGNAAARGIATNAFQTATNGYAKIATVDQSMGGILGHYMFQKYSILKGLYESYPVYSISNMFFSGAGGFSNSIASAYGISGTVTPAQFATDVAGFDPVTFTTNSFTGRPMGVCFSLADTTVPPAQNEILMTNAIITEQSTLTSGNHGDASNFPPYNYSHVNFLNGL